VVRRTPEGARAAPLRYNGRDGVEAACPDAVPRNRPLFSTMGADPRRARVLASLLMEIQRQGETSRLVEHATEPTRVVSRLREQGGSLVSAEALVVGLVNQKGGCGKTTTAVNLAASLAAQGHSTLLVDLDPQANATVSLGIDPASLERTIYHVVVDPDHDDGLPLASIIQKSTAKRLDVAPSSIDLAAAELELAARIGREAALRKRLGPVRDKYAFILIDTPPSLGLLTLNALVACDGIIIPIQTHYYALLGMRQLLRTLKMVRDEVGHQVEILGVLPTMYDSRTSISKEIVAGIHEFFPNKVYQTAVHFNIKLVESSMSGVPLYLRDPDSRGAKEYMSLASEVIAHAKRARGVAARR